MFPTVELVARPIRRAALVLAVSLSLALAGLLVACPLGNEVSTTLVTTENRADWSGSQRVRGGWAPHLRGVLRTDDGSLWMAVDRGNDVTVNEGIQYFRRVDGEWSLDGAIDLAAGPGSVGRIQQNVASLTDGETIYSYGIDVERDTLVECAYETGNGAADCSAVLPVQSNSNYVGAAVSPSGYRVAWWSTVATGADAGSWQIVWNEGDGWHASDIVSTPLPGYQNFGYVHLSFITDYRVAIAGELYYDGPQAEPHQAGAAVFEYPSSPTWVVLGEGWGTTSEDCFADPATGGVHVLVRDLDESELAYYFKGGDESWAGEEPVTTLSDTLRGRFLYSEDRDRLYLLRGSASNAGLAMRVASQPDLGAAIAWGGDGEAELVVPPPEPTGFGAPDAIYVEGRIYQNAPVQGANAAFVGTAGVKDHELWHQTLP